MLNIELDFLTWNLTLVLHSIFVIEKKEKKNLLLKKSTTSSILESKAKKYIHLQVYD